MRTNGTLSFIETNPVRTDFNEDGEPLKPYLTWSEPVKCFVQEADNDRTASYEGGKFTKVSYFVFVEGRFKVSDRIRITRDGEDLGEHQVKYSKVLSLHRTIISV